jgi:hypothetical protein
VSAVWTGAGQLTPIDAAPGTQVGMMRVAIHPGSCADTAPAPVVVLNNPVPSGSPDDPSAPLLSYTEAPVALTDLLSAPHALVVTLGGDIDAALACGDLEDSDQDGMLSVDLREQNDSGFTGVALLTAAGETSRISIVLAETPPTPLAPTSPTPPETPGAEATPRAGTPEPASETPVAAETPVGIPISALTPAAETPIAGEAPGSPYTSEQFGYTIAFDPPWQVVLGPEVDATSDYIVLSNGTSFVDFLGLAEDWTAPTCMDQVYEQIVLTRPGLHSVVPHVGRDSGATMSTPEQAIEVWDIKYTNQAGQPVAVTFYANCLVLQPGQAVFLTTHEAPQDEYAAQAELREQLYSGVSLPQAEATRGAMPEVGATREDAAAVAVTTADNALGSSNSVAQRSSDASAILLMVHNCPPGTALSEIQVTACPRAATGLEPVLTGTEGTWTGADLVAEQAGPVWHDVPHGEYVLTFEALPDGHDMYYEYGEGAPPDTDVLGGDGVAVTLGPETVTPQDFLPLTVYFVDAES